MPKREILIVEDSDVQAVLLQRILEQEGFQIIRARDGEEGLSMAKWRKPALIISDVLMPKMDGWGMCMRIKKEEEVKAPVILLTQLSEVEDVIKSLEAGADYYITKPYNPAFLLSKVAYFLENHIEVLPKREEAPTTITYGGKRFTVTSNRERIMSLLLSIYENAIEQNKELSKVQQGLATLNEQLEEKVRQRTAALVAEVEERKKIEERLRESQETLRRAQETARLGTWSMDINKNHVTWSSEMYVILGISPAKFPPSFDLFISMTHPDDRELVKTVIESALTKKEPVDVESRIVRPDGSIRHISAQCRAYREENEAGAKMVGAALDITERKNAEEELIRLNRALRMLSRGNRVLVRSSTEGDLLNAICQVIVRVGGYRMAWICYVDNGEPKTLRVAASAGYEKMDDIPIERRWPGLSAGEGPLAGVIQSKAAFIDRAILGKKESNGAIQDAKACGYASYAAMPILIGGAVAAIINVYSGSPEAFSGDEVELLEEMAEDMAFGINFIRESAARRQAEEKFRLIAEAAQDAVLLIDEEGKIRSWNESAERIFGYPAEEALGGKMSELIIPPDVRKRHEEWIKRFGETGTGAMIGRVTEISAQKSDGSIFPAELSLSAVKIHGKWMAVGLLRDITARKTSEQMLLQSEKMASIGNLAAGIAHEINNPISFVSSNQIYIKKAVEKLFGLIDGLKDSPEAVEKLLDESRPLREEFREIMEESMEGTQRIITIVKDLKPFVHVSEEHWEATDVHIIIDGALNIARNEIKYKAEVARKYESKNASIVECIPNQLGQVFLNLFVNAAQAIKDKGTITVRTSDGEDTVMVEVRDDGEGMSKENLKRIFDPFFTTKPAGKGTGLGLALSHTIIQKHNGTITVDSEPGKGTVFTITIPLRRDIPES